MANYKIGKLLTLKQDMNVWISDTNTGITNCYQWSKDDSLKIVDFDDTGRIVMPLNFKHLPQGLPIYTVLNYSANLQSTIIANIFTDTIDDPRVAEGCVWVDEHSYRTGS